MGPLSALDERGGRAPGLILSVFKGQRPTVRSPHETPEDTMGFLDRLFGSDQPDRDKRRTIPQKEL